MFNERQNMKFGGHFVFFAILKVVSMSRGAFVGFPGGDSLGSEQRASLENTLVRFKPDTKKCHNIFCQFVTTVGAYMFYD